jgi:MFS transporter, OFA family, oxalate/formate antiporter
MRDRMESATFSRGRRGLVLCFGALMMLFSGLIYAWSIFVAPLEAEFGWNRGQTSFVFTLSMSISILGQIVGGRSVSRGRGGRYLRLAAVMLVAGFFAASGIRSLPGLYLSYGVVCGFAVGICYNAVIAMTVGRFPDRVGFASGVLLMAFGLGSLVLGTVTTSLILAFGWRTAFRALAAGFGAVMLAGSFIIGSGSRASGVDIRANANADPRPAQMLRDPAYPRFFLWATAMSAAGLLIIGHSAAFAADLGASLSTAALSAGFLSLFNGGGRLVFGFVYDKNGFTRSAALAGILLTAATAGLIGALCSRQLWALFVSYAALGLAYGAIPVSVSAFTKERYGGRYYGVNLGITNLNIVGASFIGPWLAGLLRARWESYLPALLLMLALIAAGFFLAPRRAAQGLQPRSRP